MSDWDFPNALVHDTLVSWFPNWSLTAIKLRNKASKKHVF